MTPPPAARLRLVAIALGSTAVVLIGGGTWLAAFTAQRLAGALLILVGAMDLLLAFVFLRRSSDLS